MFLYTLGLIFAAFLTNLDSVNSKDRKEDCGYGCEFNGECKPARSIWYDKCKKYVCAVYKRDYGLKLGIWPTAYGCHYNNKCIPFGSTMDRENCVINKCYREYKLTPVLEQTYLDSGLVSKTFACKSEREGKCRSHGERWIENCNTKTCFVNATSSSIITVQREINLKQEGHNLYRKESLQPACREFHYILHKYCPEERTRTRIKCNSQREGKCRSHGERWIENCNTKTCFVNATSSSIITVERACNSLREGKCRISGERWIENCNTKACFVNESSSSIITVQRACNSQREGKCRKAGERWMDNCISNTCFVNATSSSIISVYTGCEFKGKCKPEKSRWSDDRLCKSYICTKQIHVGMQGFTLEAWPKSYGCPYNNKCLPFGSKVDRGNCLIHRCKKNHKLTAVQKQFYLDSMLISDPYACKSQREGKCRRPGERWIENCNTKTCFVNGTSSNITIVQTGCKDANGKCHKAGFSGCQ